MISLSSIVVSCLVLIGSNRAIKAINEPQQEIRILEAEGRLIDGRTAIIESISKEEIQKGIEVKQDAIQAAIQEIEAAQKAIQAAQQAAQLGIATQDGIPTSQQGVQIVQHIAYQAIQAAQQAAAAAQQAALAAQQAALAAQKAAEQAALEPLATQQDIVKTLQRIKAIQRAIMEASMMIKKISQNINHLAEGTISAPLFKDILTREGRIVKYLNNLKNDVMHL